MVEVPQPRSQQRQTTHTATRRRPTDPIVLASPLVLFASRSNINLTRRECIFRVHPSLFCLILATDMADPTYPLFSVFAFLGFFLVLVPLPWHLQAWNSATCYFIIWTALACLNQFANSVVWAGNALNNAPVWCDICEYHVFRSFACASPD